MDDLTRKAIWEIRGEIESMMNLPSGTGIGWCDLEEEPTPLATDVEDALTHANGHLYSSQGQIHMAVIRAALEAKRVGAPSNMKRAIKFFIDSEITRNWWATGELIAWLDAQEAGE